MHDSALKVKTPFLHKTQIFPSQEYNSGTLYRSSQGRGPCFFVHVNSSKTREKILQQTIIPIALYDKGLN